MFSSNKFKVRDDIINAMAFGNTYWGVRKPNMTLIDPSTGTETKSVVGVYYQGHITKTLEATSAHYLELGKLNDASDNDSKRVVAERTDGKTASSYASPGCFFVNFSLLTLTKWAYKKPENKKQAGQPQGDEMAIMIQEEGNLSSKEFKTYLESITKAVKATMKTHNTVVFSRSVLAEPQNMDTIIDNAILDIMMVPTLVALAYCACNLSYYGGDRNCAYILNEIMRCFPQEYKKFARAVDFYLNEANIFNTTGILDTNGGGGKVSADTVRVVALTLVGPNIYASAVALRAEGEKLKRGEITIKDYKKAIRYIDYYTYTTNIYIAESEDGFSHITDRWRMYSAKIGFIVARFGYDIVGTILGCPKPNTTALNLDDKFNLRRRELIEKFDSTFNVYDSNGVFIGTKDTMFKKFLERENLFDLDDFVGVLAIASTILGIVSILGGV